MTRQEQAKFRRLEKRHDSLLSALCIIRTWISIPGDPKENLYYIAKLATERIEEDKRNERKEVRDGKTAE
jgi:hypothetical protein